MASCAADSASAATPRALASLSTVEEDQKLKAESQLWLFKKN
ncbi:hypothetical protein ACMD2_04668 [Ananas comosus]|uniref:Uncharacterized protein n=1 Tax=Ananas comosus TaxID=4615 RepID=A0A199VUT9_ANACO|nr:hypothetical protein ACMD2_04668 [Ananas comosus]